MRRRPPGTYLAPLLALLLSAPASGAPAGESAVDTLLRRLGDDVARALEGEEIATLAYVLRAGGPADDAPAAGELGRVVRALLPASLRRRAGIPHVVPLPAFEAGRVEAEAARIGAAYVLVLTLSLVEDELVLAGTLVPTWVNFFTGEIQGEAHSVSATARADRSARLLLRTSVASAPATTTLRLVPVGEAGPDVIALSIGDALGDGRRVVALLGEDRLGILRLEGDGLQPVAEMDLGDRGLALVRARAPMGGVVIETFAARPSILFRHERHARGAVVRLRGGRPRRVTDTEDLPLAHAPGLVLFASLQVGASRAGPELRLVGPGLAATLDAGTEFLEAALTPDGRELFLLRTDHHLLRFAIDREGDAIRLRPLPLRAPRSGVGLAIADLDGDGVLERVASAPLPPGLSDRIQIAELTGPAREERPIPGAVRAAASGDLNGDGRDDVLFATLVGQTTYLYLLTAAP